MSDSDTSFSKVRLEMLCDGIFCVAMTLLALELKAPELPKQATSAEILHALREHGLAFFGFALTFILAGQFWILHHRLFQHLRRVNRALVALTIPFLMFVSLLPFSTSMLTSFSLRQPVSLFFYIGNQFVLSSLLAAQWLLARRSGLFAGSDDDSHRRRFERMIFIQPFCFLIALGVVFVSPRNALLAVALSWAILNGITRRMDKARRGAGL